METIKRTVLWLCLALAAPPSLAAAGAAPDALLSAVTTEVMAALKQDDNPARLAGLVEKKVLPLFNFTRMAQLAMARNWRLATAEQRTALTEEFRMLLVRTYSVALSGYRDQVITYKPLRAETGDTDVTVRSLVKQGSGQMKIDYDMERTAAGWKVYDIKIDNVSVITAYRDGFAAKVRDAGLDGLIQALAEKNRQGAAATAAVVQAR